MCLLLILTAGLAATARAQFVVGASGENVPSCLCNKTFADANATGIFSFNPNVNQGPQEDQPDNYSHYTLDAQWGMTVYDNIGASNATAELTGWYNTGGANYSDNESLWYDFCVITMNSLTPNSYARGAADDGDCLTTFDEACVAALKAQAIDFTVGLVGNPTPNPGSNLTDGSIGHVCYDIGSAMGRNFAKECNPFFNETVSVYGTAMTSSSSQDPSFLYDGCTLTNEEANTTFHYATGSVLFATQYTEEQQRVLYANLTQIVLPVLTVWLPIADIEASPSISTVSPILSCPHINNINAGSLEPYPPPETTPLGGQSNLNGGAIAGIVIGALAAIGAVLAGFWFFWFRKQRAAEKGRASEDPEHPPPAYTADTKVTGVPVDPSTELDGQEDRQLRPELPTQKSAPRVELAGDAIHKNGQGPLAELPVGTK